MTRFIKISLVFIMLLTCQIALCSNVFAFSGNGQGTPENPYLITNAQQLDEIRNELTATYKLTTDIDLQNVAWTPIGNTYTTSFRGTFDGGGYTISNLKINAATNDYVGLFGNVTQATIKNINIHNVDIQGQDYTGGLVGYMSGSKIENSSVTGTGKISGKSSVGGLTGYLMQNSVSESNATVDVIGTGSGIGGLVGVNSSSTITKCYATGNVKGASNVGGLSGSINALNTTSITECYATGDVTGTGNAVGGLVGYAYANSVKHRIQNSFALGNVQGNASCGGLVGTVSTYYTEIVNCYSVGKVIGTSGIGGLIGSGTPVLLSNSYFDATTSGITTPTSLARTTAQLKQQGTFIQWNMVSIWQINEEMTYPYLRSLPSPFREVIPSPETIIYKDLTATSVIIEWSAAPGATIYEIVCIGKDTYATSSLNMTFNDLSPNTEYRFRVRGKNDNDEGSWSRILTISTYPLPLAKVVDLVCEAKTGVSVNLAWSAVPDADGYEILLSSKPIKTVYITSATIADLMPNTTYSFQVRAFNANEKGLLSDILTVKTMLFDPQTAYAREFYNKCEDQMWLMDELEIILNKQAKSLNTIESKQDFSNVFALGLANKKISGFIPKSIGELYNLEYLYLSNNNLSGSLPAEIYTLTKLKNLDLSGNQFSGFLSEQISALAQLEALLLHNNEFEGVIPTSIGQLSHLQNLDLAINKLEGAIPSSIINLQNMKFLSLSDNNLTGTLPAGFSKLPKLEVLILSNNLINGNVTTVFKDTATVKLIDLSNNALGDIDKTTLGQGEDSLVIVIK